MLLSSCSTPKFYNEVKRIHIDYGEKSYDKHNKLILQEFTKLPINTNHIIYHYVHWGLYEPILFGALIYDVDNNKYYTVQNSEEHPDIMNISNIEVQKNDYQSFVLSKYLNGEIDYLIWLGNNHMKSGPIPIEAIYDIDLKNKVYKRFLYQNIDFLYGMPYLETPEGKKALEFEKVEPYKKPSP